jgi:hypothetical protein
VWHSGPIRATFAPAIIMIAVVPVMGILVVAILIMAVVRVLLPTIIVVTTARMREVASTIGDGIATILIVAISTMISIVAVRIAAIGSIIIAVLRIRHVPIGAMVISIPRTAIVATARLEGRSRRRWRHLYDYRPLIDPLGNSCALARMYAENAVVRRSACWSCCHPTIVMVAPIVIVADVNVMVHRTRVHDDFVIDDGHATWN